MGKFYWVNLESTNYSKRILMEAGTQFENKSAIYTMNSNGKLSIFDKENKKESNGNKIKLKDYQYQTLEAVMNNDKDGKKVAALSNSDIKKAIEKSSKGKLEKDLSQFLKGNYEVENPKAFTKENKFSAYITNGIKNTSAVLSFSFNAKPVTAKKEEAKVSSVNKPEEKTPAQSRKGAFLGNNLFNSKSVITDKAFTYTVQKGDNLVTIARKYEIDTYQLIAANPQLKKGKDYKVTYPRNSLAQLTSKLKAGQKITIPARYKVKANSCKSLKDVATITGVSESYLKDFLTKAEVAGHTGKPDLVAYSDDDGPAGTVTIGFGHTGRVDGKPIIDKRTKITNEKALEILAEDLMKHKAMTMAYLGETNYKKAPKSVQNAILDVAYNKGIWDGYLTNQGYASETSRIKKDLAEGHYASALVHTRRMKTGYAGLKIRNVYRFISGLTDLTPEQRQKAMKAMEPYYISLLKSRQKYPVQQRALRQAWANAKKGKTTGYSYQ